MDNMKRVILSGVVHRPDWHPVILVSFLTTLLLVTACGDHSGTDAELFDPVKASQLWNTADKTWSVDELETLENGRKLYRSRCAGCHQASGAGSTTIGAPALKGSAVTMGSVDVLIRTVLFGRGSMPAFRKSLDDVELAVILTYVRNAWGNEMQDILQLSSVAEIRGSGE